MLGRTRCTRVWVPTAVPQRHLVASRKNMRALLWRGAPCRSPEYLLRARTWARNFCTLSGQLTLLILPPALPGGRKRLGLERVGGPRRTWFLAGPSQSCFQQWLLMSLSSALSPQPPVFPCPCFSLASWMIICALLLSSHFRGKYKMSYGSNKRHSLSTCSVPEAA